MLDVICVGAATQDVFVSSDQTCLINIRNADCDQSYLAYEYGAKVTVDRLFVSTGGGACNTATGFARLGLRTAIICEVGEDDAGRMVGRVLQGEGVEIGMMTHNSELQTAYSVVLTGPTGDRTVLVHRGAASSLTRPEVEWGIVRQSRWVHLCSLSGESASLWQDFALCAEEHGVKLSLNPGSHQLKQGLEGLRPALACAEVVYLNRREACLLTGVEEKRSDEDEKQALQMLADCGCKLVVMTRGGEGAIGYDGSEFCSVPAPQVKVVSNLGAGDAFACACTAALHRGLPLPEALRVASLNSGSVVSYLDATSGLLSWETIEGQLAGGGGALIVE